MSLLCRYYLHYAYKTFGSRNMITLPLACLSSCHFLLLYLCAGTELGAECLYLDNLNFSSSGLFLSVESFHLIKGGKDALIPLCPLSFSLLQQRPQLVWWTSCPYPVLVRHWLVRCSVLDLPLQEMQELPGTEKDITLESHQAAGRKRIKQRYRCKACRHSL